ncbi:hypothetical protein D3C81_1815730 [compost metagenome]
MKRCTHTRQIGVPVLAQHHPLVEPQKQWPAQLGFESANLVTDSGLGDIEFFGSLGEAHVPGDRFKGAQAIQRGKSDRHGSECS